LAVATFQTCWYRSILDKVRFDDQAIANFDGGLDANTTIFWDADIRHINQARNPGPNKQLISTN